MNKRQMPLSVNHKALVPYSMADNRCFVVAISDLVNYSVSPTAFSEGCGIMELHKGTHGTCKSRAIVISEKGFEMFNSQPIRGNGVYFWRDNTYGVELAMCWYKKQFSKGEYSREKLQTCSVIKADIKAEQDQTINMEDPAIKDIVLKTIQDKGVKSKHGICAVFDKYIEFVERGIKKKIQMVLTQVQAPESDIYPKAYINTAYCYVVRQIDCISVTAIDHY